MEFQNWFLGLLRKEQGLRSEERGHFFSDCSLPTQCRAVYPESCVYLMTYNNNDNPATKHLLCKENSTPSDLFSFKNRNVTRIIHLEVKNVLWLKKVLSFVKGFIVNFELRRLHF